MRGGSATRGLAMDARADFDRGAPFARAWCRRLLEFRMARSDASETVVALRKANASGILVDTKPCLISKPVSEGPTNKAPFSLRRRIRMATARCCVAPSKYIRTLRQKIMS